VPTSFPAGLDNFTNPASTDPQNSPSHSAQHANANDAIEALQAKVGIDGSLDTDSLDYRVTAAETAGHTHVWGETPTGTVDGINATFALAAAPTPAASLLLFLNGILQRPGGHDFTLASGTITFTAAPESGSALLAHYVV